jgi:DNA repair protein RecO (recombination protein O)
VPPFKAKAITLKTRPFAEADKMVTLFSLEYGKLRVLAKSARRVPSRLGGKVETLSYGEYLIAKGRSIDIVSQCEVIETFQSVRCNPATLMISLYFLKLVDAGTSEGQHNPGLFDLLLKGLTALKEGKDPRTVELRFEKAFMRREGIYREGVEPKYCLSEHMGVDLTRW